MNNIGGTSRFIAFIDECGDHSLEKIDRDFPLFLLASIVVERSVYIDQIIPAMGALKMQYWNHEGVNLHSREIRKALGPFSFMQVPDIRLRFLEQLTTLMADLPFMLFVAGIRKDCHVHKYGKDATNPYSLALEFALEQIVNFLDKMGEMELPCVVEGRGRKEDEQLQRVFHKLMTPDTGEHPRSLFSNLSCSLVFRSKRDNIAGIQLADLCAHPCARHILRPEQVNRAYDIAQNHIYKEGDACGWKIFP